MLDPRRLSIDEVTLLRQWCSTPQLLDALARNAVRCADLWRDKTREHGVAETARLAGTQDLRFARGMMGDGVIDLPALRRSVEAAGYDGYVEVEIFSQRNWWRRDPDEVIGVIKERVETAA
jgi:sugar phosphate isomerase/epimerase